MGLFQLLSAARYERAIEAAIPVDPSTYPIATPWGSSQLQAIVAADVFGTDVPINTREAAMRIPAVARARNRVVSAIARTPLVAMRRGDVLPDQPTWLYSAAGGASPQLRLAWTVDDLMFYGWSAWWRQNNADGFPGRAGRIPFGDWAINDDAQVEVNGSPVPDNSVIVIPGQHEGILTYGVDALRDIRALYAGVRKRLRNPTPVVDLHQTGGRDLTDDEIDVLITRWAAARNGDNGGVSYTSQHLEAKFPGGGDDGQLMIESRNAAAVDIARMIGVAASVIDATAPKASLNYETTSGRNLEFVDQDLPLYMDPIAWRLSLDDTTPSGQHVAFDNTATTSPTYTPTGPTLED